MRQISLRGPDPLREHDLVTSAGKIDRSILMRISVQRARREREAYIATGASVAWRELLAEEMRRTWSIAELMHACEHDRRAIANMPAIERDARQLELQLERLRHGLATPSHPKTQDDIARLEALLGRAREAQPGGAVPSRIRIGHSRFKHAGPRVRPRATSKNRRLSKIIRPPAKRITSRRRKAGA